jgi:hypothetical protein
MTNAAWYKREATQMETTSELEEKFKPFLANLRATGLNDLADEIEGLLKDYRTDLNGTATQKWIAADEIEKIILRKKQSLDSRDDLS